MPPADDGAVTLRDLARRMDSLHGNLLGLPGVVTTALADSTRSMDELRREITSLSQDRVDN